MAPPGSAPLTFLGDYAEDAGALDDETFGRRHGHAFLLHSGPLGALRPAGDARTVSYDEPAGEGAAAPPQLDFVVFPIRTQGESTAARLATVGRDASNNVVIDDASVSKLHAVLRVSPSGPASVIGEVEINDSGSQNGTFVNEVRVPRTGAGAPVRLNAGDRIRLGAVVLTYLPLWHFLNLIRRTSR